MRTVLLVTIAVWLSLGADVNPTQTLPEPAAALETKTLPWELTLFAIPGTLIDQRQVSTLAAVYDRIVKIEGRGCPGLQVVIRNNGRSLDLLIPDDTKRSFNLLYVLTEFSHPGIRKLLYQEDSDEAGRFYRVIPVSPGRRGTN